MDKFSEWVSIAVIGGVIVVALSMLLALPVMWLWDWIMPEMFGLKPITWLHAWGLAMLCGLLFKPMTSGKK